MDRPLGPVRETPFVNPIISTNGLISLTRNCQLPGRRESALHTGLDFFCVKYILLVEKQIGEGPTEFFHKRILGL